ncbi:hypothetical protein P7C70_g2215, partial [Phenoliferia sp. Uapishka_3]
MPTVPANTSLYEPVSPLLPLFPNADAKLHSSFPHIFDHFVSATGARFRSTEPRVDVVEVGPKTIFMINLPGCPRSAIDIIVHDGALTVTGFWGSSHPSDAVVEVEERPKGAFRRSFRVPKDLTAKDIVAKTVDGVLQIEFARKMSGQPEGEKVTVM